MPVSQMPVSRRLVEIRKAKQMSRRALSMKSGVALSFVNAIESGQKSPTVRTLEKLAAALGVPVSELLDDKI